MLLQLPCEEVVRAPPEAEERAEKECGAEAVVDSAEAVTPIYLRQAVNGPTVQALRLVGCVLYLQACLDVLDGCSDERYCPPSQRSRCSVADHREFALLAAIWCSRIEEVVVENATVYAEGAEHAAAC